MPKPLKMPKNSRQAIKLSKPRGPGLSMKVEKVENIELKDPIRSEMMGLINGRTPDSYWEWNMAVALWHYGWDGFIYQLALKGGYEIKGGRILDFLLPTIPAWSALEVDGGYWHRNDNQLKLRDQEIIKALKAKGYFVRSDVYHATDKSVVTVEAAMRYVYTNFGRA